jgi:hypothetical protein
MNIYEPQNFYFISIKSVSFCVHLWVSRYPLKLNFKVTMFQELMMNRSSLYIGIWAKSGTINPIFRSLAGCNQLQQLSDKFFGREQLL